MWDQTRVIQLLEDILEKLNSISVVQDNIYNLLLEHLPDPQVVETCLLVVALSSLLNIFFKKRYQV